MRVEDAPGNVFALRTAASNEQRDLMARLDVLNAGPYTRCRRLGLAEDLSVTELELRVAAIKARLAEIREFIKTSSPDAPPGPIMGRRN